VMPHPPILNALNRAAKLLEEAGHEVVEFEPYQSQRAWDIAVIISLALHLWVCTKPKQVSPLLCNGWERNGLPSSRIQRTLATIGWKVEREP
jgi:Asp-tRNA(Asn)/Glu-tRNA(Gln) amidotransferase A subunit family amidase